VPSRLFCLFFRAGTEARPYKCRNLQKFVDEKGIVFYIVIWYNNIATRFTYMYSIKLNIIP